MSKLRQTLELPDDVRFVAVVTMGYPAGDPVDEPSGGASVTLDISSKPPSTIEWE